MSAPVASGWSGRRVGLAPIEKRRLVTAHCDSMLQIADDAGNLHVRFDERSVETEARVEPVRHRQTKGAATDLFGLQTPRHTPTLPFPDIRTAYVAGDASAGAGISTLPRRRDRVPRQQQRPA
jgi:hypothetical protein